MNRNWKPEYSPWRHGGWYVTNVHYPSGACGCVSRNYADRKWRIACDPRGFDAAPTFKCRDDAARAELELAQAESPKTPQEPPDAAPATEALPEARSPAACQPANDAEAKRRADLELPYYQLAGQTQPRPEGPQADMFGAAGLDRKPEGNLRHGGGTLL